jgi:DNA-binding phage protein
MNGRANATIFLEMEGVIGLLRAEVERAGGQAAWAKAAGVDRTLVNSILKGRRMPTKKIVSALNLRTVFVSKLRSQP